MFSIQEKLPLPFWIMFLNTFTMAIGFFMIIPLFAFHLMENIGFATVVVGIVVAIRSFSQQGMMIICGAIADKIGYKTTICIGVLIRAVGFGFFGFASDLPFFIIGAILSGLGGALFHPASYAYYAQLTSENNRITIYSIREMLSNLGFIIGPLIGSFLLSFDFLYVSLASAFLFFLSYLLTQFFLPNMKDKEVPTSRQPVLTSLIEVSKNIPFINFSILMLLSWILISQLHLAVPVIVSQYSLSPVHMGYAYSAGAILMVILQLPLAKLCNKYLKPLHTISVGVLSISFGLLLLGILGGLAGLFIGVILFTIGQVLIQPMMNSLISKYAPSEKIATYFGYNGFSLAIGGVIGSVGGGYLYDISHIEKYLYVPWLTFSSLGIVLAIYLLKQRRI